MGWPHEVPCDGTRSSVHHHVRGMAALQPNGAQAQSHPAQFLEQHWPPPHGGSTGPQCTVHVMLANDVMVIIATDVKQYVLLDVIQTWMHLIATNVWNCVSYSCNWGYNHHIMIHHKLSVIWRGHSVSWWQCRTPRFMAVCTVPLSWWLMNRTAAKCTWRRPHSCYINQI